MDDFGEWLRLGIDKGWVSDPFCTTHGVDPWMSDEEQAEWEDGGDPCCHVVRLAL